MACYTPVFVSLSLKLNLSLLLIHNI
uniref:Uncharacterized protein n=1 Tax=Anguilla anguilla TaxID=7936 RepID=A0A0E9PKL7_ANGAN